jgi:hypothetical protein
MDDYKEKADEYKDQLLSKAAAVDQKGKFFTFSKPFTDMIDNGTLFTKYAGILYQVIGGLLMIYPLYVLYNAFDGGLFDMPFKYVILAFVFFAAFALSCWISFQIFFNRKDQFKDLDGSKGYIATSIASNFTRTIGESIAVFLALVGTPMAILALIFDDAQYFLFLVMDYSASFVAPGFPAGFGSEYADVFYFPIAAFCTLVWWRFLSELMNGIADIARNTKR